MSEQPPRSTAIEPALTEVEWKDAQKYGIDSNGIDCGPTSFSEWHETIALANAALPDSDPRKITREKLQALRVAAVALETDAAAFNVDNTPHIAAVRAMAEALASYLPPA